MKEHGIREPDGSITVVQEPEWFEKRCANHPHCDAIVNEDDLELCGICDKEFCSACMVTKADAEYHICQECAEKIVYEDPDLEKIRAGIKEIESQAEQAHREICDDLRLGRIQGTCKVLLALLPKEAPK